MSISTYAAYRATRPVGVLQSAKTFISTVDGRLFDKWVSAPFNGTAPTSPVVPASNVLGSLTPVPAGIAMWFKTLRSAKTPGQSFTIFDRLSHMGGLSGTVTGAVTTNLPTAALTRYTSGVGVFMAISIYATVGTTATTLSVSYTNSDGTAGRTSPLITFGGANDRTVGTFLPIPFQVGDVGVRSVESVTAAGTTGTAGAYGITLWKPIISFPTSDLCRRQDFDVVRDLGAMFGSVEADACLGLMVGSNTTQTWQTVHSFTLIKQQ